MTPIPRLDLLTPSEAAEVLHGHSAESALQSLQLLSPGQAWEIVQFLPPTFRAEIARLAPPEQLLEWEAASRFPENSIGRLYKPTSAVFPSEATVGEAIETLRHLVTREFVTYLFVVDAEGKLVGVVTMRDLLLSDKDKPLGDVMLRDVFALSAHADVLSAMRETLGRHFPVYPVVDEHGKFLGLVRGSSLFEAQAFELSAQAGSMVGVEKEERLSTPWRRSFLFRHPWLQLNLLTAFLAAAVVGAFEETISQVVALAVFLPVLAGQSGNTGCQALAVALRAITLGEMKSGEAGRTLIKEGLLGLLNGIFVGITAGLGMWIFAAWQKNPQAGILSLVVFLAMVGSCIVSGICGAGIPLILKKLGADPATASSIFLTTATDVVSMGLFLWLATVLIL